MSVIIDIPFPEDCEHCLLGNLLPEAPRRELGEKGLQYRTYCKVTGTRSNEKERNEDCPLHLVEPKTGTWIKMINTNYSPFDNSGEYIGICSECGYKVNLEDGGIYSFCSACGAPMTEGEQDGHK